MSKKINLNFNLIDLNGSERINDNAGKIIAQMLSFDSKGDPLKLWGWALKLNKGEVLELDDSDYITFKEIVSSNESLPVITKAQVLKAIMDVK